jgi:hypothetical protein
VPRLLSCNAMLSGKIFKFVLLPARNALAILVPTWVVLSSAMPVLPPQSLLLLDRIDSAFCTNKKKGNVLAISGSRSTKVSHFLRRYTSPLCSFAREIPILVQLLRHLTEIAPCNNEVKDHLLYAWLAHFKGKL